MLKLLDPTNIIRKDNTKKRLAKVLCQTTREGKTQMEKKHCNSTVVISDADTLKKKDTVTHTRKAYVDEI